MLETVIVVLIFCIVLFLYLHVYFHLKTSDDLEVYEIDEPSKDRLEEICDIRQPVIFDYPNQRLLESANHDALCYSYGAFDVKMRDVNDNDDETEMYMPLPLRVANEALYSDTQSKYLSENNRDFLEETGTIKSFQYNDAFLRPYMVSNCIYDIVMASTGTCTPLRYEVNYRNYFMVTQGRLKIILIPPKDSKYLYPHNDYDNFEFRSPVKPWNVQREYKADFDKIKTLEVELTPGKMIFIPAFWWHSMSFVEKNTSVCVFKYRTYMNTIAISPKIAMNLLQRQNVKREIVKKVVQPPQVNESGVAASIPSHPVHTAHPAHLPFVPPQPSTPPNPSIDLHPDSAIHAAITNPSDPLPA